MASQNANEKATPSTNCMGLEILHKHLQKVWDDSKEQLDGLKSAKDTIRELKQIRVKLHDFELSYAQYKAELVAIKDTRENQHFIRQYQKRGKQHKRNLDSLRADLDWQMEMLHKEDRKELIGDHMVEMVPTSGEGLMNYGIKTAEDANLSLHRTLGKINTTRQMGREISDKLNTQTEQLKGVMNNTIDISESLRLSKRSIVSMARTIYTDGAMKVIFSAIFLVITAMLIYAQVS